MAWIAPITADAHKRQEETAMIKKLRDADPDGKYEFKIIRAGINAFRDEDFLQEVLDQERQGNWEFVERIDNAGVVLRRPLGSRSNDIHLDPTYDPYRTNYGTGSVNVIGILLGLVMLVGMIFLGGYLSIRQDPGTSGLGASPSIFIVVVMVFVLFVIVMIKQKRK